MIWLNYPVFCPNCVFTKIKKAITTTRTKNWYLSVFFQLLKASTVCRLFKTKHEIAVSKFDVLSRGRIKYNVEEMAERRFTLKSRNFGLFFSFIEDLHSTKIIHSIIKLSEFIFLWKGCEVTFIGSGIWQGCFNTQFLSETTVHICVFIIDNSERPDSIAVQRPKGALGTDYSKANEIRIFENCSSEYSFSVGDGL